MLVDEECVLDPDTLQEGDIVAYKYYLQTDILFYTFIILFYNNCFLLLLLYIDNGRLINPKIYKRMEELTWEEIANQKRVVLSSINLLL